MDSYSPLLIEHGLKGMIGKGKRSAEVIEAMKRQQGACTWPPSAAPGP